METATSDDKSLLGRALRQGRAVAPMLPVLTVAFVAYLVVGLAMPVIPLHVHQGLGLDTFVVGLVAGAQFAAALIARLWSGRHADKRGAKRTVVTGLVAAAGGGLLYLLSLRFVGTPETSAAVLLLGRALLGGGQSFIVVGALSWGLAVMGPQHTGKILAWVGIALYAAFAIGAPIGTALYGAFGFMAIALATALVPLAALPLTASIRSGAQPPAVRAPFRTVIGAVWVPGLGLGFSGVGFGAITTFIALLFVTRGWGLVWLAFTTQAVAFIGGRLVFGNVPDRIGGAKVALVCVTVEALGLASIWLAPVVAVALVGIVLAGIGYSLAYPSFGVEAVRRAPPQGRGFAMGVYTAFFDLSVGITSPALGLVADHAGQGAVFLTGTAVVLCATVVALRLLRAPPRAVAEE